MAALALNGGPGGPHRRRSPLPWGRVVAAGGIALAAFVVWTMFSAQIVTKRPNEMKTTQVILPPPPPPPPPPEIKPEEKPPEPTEAPPIDQPIDTPPPPDQAKEQSASPSSDPAPGDNALSAREGAGPSNYGLAVGNGGGTRIGGRAGGGGGNGFATYAQSALAEIRRATQADRELARGRYSLKLLVTVAEDGRITGIRLLDGSGSERRDARLVALLNRLQLQRPPAGMPAMRIEFNTRSGA